MKWHATQAGEERIVRKFALFPRRIDKEWVWLEHYYSHQKYTSTYDFDGVAWSWGEYKRTLCCCDSSDSSCP